MTKVAHVSQFRYESQGVHADMDVFRPGILVAPENDTKLLCEGTTMRLLAAAIAGLVLSSTSVIAEHDHEPKKPKHAKHAVAGHDDAAVTPMAVRVSWTTHDVEVIRRHYTPKYRDLPPGLRKKYQRTGELPPGWQKKMEPLPERLEQECAPLPTGYRRGVFDGHAVIYNPRGTIIDVAVLF